MPVQKSKYGNDKEFMRGLATGIRNFATRPDIRGYKPHNKQEIFHSSPARKRLFAGGNRSGKTTGGATEIVWWATGKHPFLETPKPPVRLRAVTVDFINGLSKIMLPEIARWMPPSELRNSSWEDSYNKELRTLTLDNGSFIEFMSHDQDLDKFAGTSRHGIWFDEECPEEIYHECLLRLLDTEGSMWMTLTPLEGMGWVYDELYEKAKTDDSIFALVVEMTDNPYLNSTEAEAFLSGLSEEEKKIRMKGQFIQIGGLIYPMFNREKHILEPFIPPENWLHFASLDHGFNNPTAWLWCAVDPDGRVIVYDEHYESGKVVSQHAQIVHERNISHKIQPLYYVGDPSINQTNPLTGTSVQIEYMEFGIPINPANNEVVAGLNRVIRYLQGINGNCEPPRLFITKNCGNLIWEMSRLRWATFAHRKIVKDRNKKEEQHKKDDHACDALRYAIASRPEGDKGVAIPQIGGPRGMSVPVGLIRKVPVMGPTRPNYDSMLGTDW